MANVKDFADGLTDSDYYLVAGILRLPIRTL